MRPIKAQIDLGAIAHNLGEVKRLAPYSKVMGSIKANAYGHGILKVANTLQESGIEGLAVASIDEALLLRQAGITCVILLLGGCFSVEELKVCEQNNLAIVIHSRQQLVEFMETRLQKPLDVWLKINTGMNRLGIGLEEYMDVYQVLHDSKQCRHVTQMTQFDCANEPDSRRTLEQIQLFFSSTADNDASCSLSNSAAIIRYPHSHRDWVRPGAMLYGVNPFYPHQELDLPAFEIHSAMTFTAQIIAIHHLSALDTVGYNRSWQASKVSSIAVICCGYGDGYPPNLRDGQALVGHQLASIVGTAAMDMMMLDVSHIKCCVGDMVELWGKGLPIESLASKTGYSPYWYLTGLSNRVLREYSH